MPSNAAKHPLVRNGHVRPMFLQPLYKEIDEREFGGRPFSKSIDHFTVVYLVTWPMNESKARVDLVLIKTSLLFVCKFQLISMKTKSST